MEERRENKIQENTPQNMSAINEFLCRIAGSDLSILAQCPHEISRYSRIGAIIISTAALAFVSMFFAIQTISQSTFTGIVAGLIWGIVIFNLDSYIVASYKKNENKWIEVKVVIPRLILAIVLGCSISIPLELKVFENEITEKIKIIEGEEELKQKQQANEFYSKEITPFLSEKNTIQADNIRISAEIQPLIDKVNRLEKDLSDETAGVGRTKRASYGPVAQQIDGQLKLARIDLIAKEAKINPMLNLNSKRTSQLDSAIARVVIKPTSKVNLYGISAQLEGLKRLTNSNNYVLLAYWVFFLLILGVETAPIFVKFFTPKGSYDEIFSMNEYITSIEQQKRKSDFHDIINSEMAALRSINERKRNAQDLVNDKLMNDIAKAQGEIAEKAIRLWKEKQLQNVEQNLPNYIKENNGFESEDSTVIKGPQNDVL